MATRNFFIKPSVIIAIIITFSSCSKDGNIPGSNELLKKIKQGDYIVEEISYNQDNLVIEVNSTVFYRKFHYDQKMRLIKEEIAISPNSYSSSIIPGSTHEFVDPNKTGITMYQIYEYDKNGRLSQQLNYIPKDGDDELRSKRTFEYNDKNLISKVLIYNNDNEVTQFRTYDYDPNENVIEEDYYTFLFITYGPSPRHVSKSTFEYDPFNNPYKIFKKSCNPGVHTNTNNIIKTKTTNYDPTLGATPFSESTTSYEYNYETGYPTKVVNGEEFIYE